MDFSFGEVSPPLFKSYRLGLEYPFVPQALVEDLESGVAVVEVDEKLFFYVKALYWSHIVFESAERYIFAVKQNPQQFAEGFREGERFYFRPPGTIEN